MDAEITDMSDHETSLRSPTSSHFRFWIPGLILLAVLYLMYSSVFLTDYLMNDEWQLIGSHPGLRQSAKESFLFWGRGLFGIYSALVYRFVGYNPLRVQIVRFVNFVSLCAIALLFFRFLLRKSNSLWLSFSAILFLYSTGSLQEAFAYSLQLISNTQPSMWFSLLAFYVYFCLDGTRFGRWVRLGAAFVFLILAMQSTQTFAFFAMVPITYLALSDWRNEHRRIIEFLSLSVFVLLFSSVAYKGALHYLHTHGRQGYPLAEESIESVGQHPLSVLLHAINPLSYWSAFEIWSYPFPFHVSQPSQNLRIALALCFMTVWAVLIVWAATVEAGQRVAQGNNREVFGKWLAVLICLGLNAVFIVADSPLVTIEHRPHMVLAFVGIVIFSAAYCLQVVAARYPILTGGLAKTIFVIFAAIVTLGAQADTLRGYVDHRMQLLNFIKTAVVSKDPSSYQNIIVVVPETGPEPRGVWVGHAIQRRWHMTREGAYRYVLAALGIPPESKTITFVANAPKEVPENSVLINWQSYIALRQKDPF